MRRKECLRGLPGPLQGFVVGEVPAWSAKAIAGAVKLIKIVGVGFCFLFSVYDPLDLRLILCLDGGYYSHVAARTDQTQLLVASVCVCVCCAHGACIS